MGIEYVGHSHELDHKMVSSWLSFISHKVLTYQFETLVPEQGDISFVDSSHGTLETLKRVFCNSWFKMFYYPSGLCEGWKQRISNLHAKIILKTATSELKSTTKAPFRGDNVCWIPRSTCQDMSGGDKGRQL